MKIVIHNVETMIQLSKKLIPLQLYIIEVLLK